MNERKIKIIELYNNGNNGKTLKEIGEIYGISKQRIHQIIYGYSFARKKKIKIEFSEENKFNNINSINLSSLEEIKERKKIIYQLLNNVSYYWIRIILQKFVNLNEKIRPIKYINLTKETGMNSGGRERYRELVRKRDNYRCQLCGFKWISGRRLDVHHIYDKFGKKSRECDKRFDEMITLCHQCHLRIDGWKISRNNAIRKGLVFPQVKPLTK